MAEQQYIVLGGERRTAPYQRLPRSLWPQGLPRRASLWGYPLLKRGLGLTLSACALVALAPCMLLLALVIYLDDPHGSPFFVQERVGKDGQVFRFYKLRSMYVGADQMLTQLLAQNEVDGPAFKMKNDPRVTRVGKLIRKCSLDELPQLLNIIKGDMCIVGPRPPLPREVAQYNEHQMLRLAVRPGLTCYWQTQKKRNDTSFDHWVDLDLRYIREQNLWVDAKLVLKTLKVMVLGEGV